MQLRQNRRFRPDKTGGSGYKTGCSGFKHLPGQNRKFRFLKPAVPVLAGHWRTVRSKEPDRPRLDFDVATMAQRRHGRVPAAEQGRRRRARGVLGRGEAHPAADGEERRRGGGATERSGGGRRSLPGALRGDGRGRVRMGTGRGVVGDAPHMRNRATAQRRRRIDGEGGARTATTIGNGERARVWVGGERAGRTLRRGEE